MFSWSACERNFEGQRVVIVGLAISVAILVLILAWRPDGEKRALMKVFGNELYSDVQVIRYHRDVDLYGSVDVRIDFYAENSAIVDRLVLRLGLALCGRPEDEIGWRLDADGVRKPILRGRYRYCIEHNDGNGIALTYNPRTGLCSYFESIEL